MDGPKNVRELIEQGYASPTLLPEEKYLNEGGVLDLTKLDRLNAYTIFLVEEDYPASTDLMWNPTFRELDVNIRNITLVTDKNNLEFVLSVLKTDQKYLGGCVGSGLKNAASLYVDQKVPNWISSVNSIVNDRGLLVGRDTDAEGFIQGLEEELRLNGKSVHGSKLVVLGATGVAPDICRLLAERGADRIIILNRTIENAENIARNLKGYNVRVRFDGEDSIGEYLLDQDPVDVVINLSRKGSPGTSLAGYASFAMTAPKMTVEENNRVSENIARRLAAERPNTIVYDITCQRKGSKTYDICQKAGIKHFLNGVGMVVRQSVPTFYLIQIAHEEEFGTKLLQEEIFERFRKFNRF